MIKHFKGHLAVALALILGFGLLMTSCQKEEANTKVILDSFGPSPSLRGGELKFIGSNLDKVTKIILPDNVEVTSFVSKASELLVLEVPMETVDGKVTLKTPDGDIVSKTLLLISEPITIATMAPAEIRPGELLTITGTYLNLISEVIFPKGKLVAQLQSQSKTEIKVMVPEDAQTGRIVLSNGEEDPILVESDIDLIVSIPAISSLSPNPVKAGTKLTISGTNLDLTRDIIFSGGHTVTDFVSKSATKIELTVPGASQDGNIKLVVKSDVAVESESMLVLALPSVSSVSPNPAKNGANLIITGSDLDLVTSIVFGGDKTGEVSEQSATSLTVVVPADAIDGPAVLNTAANKSISTENVAFVVPTITSISPLELKSNTDVTIAGTDLDLVVKVIFTGGNEVDVTAVTATELVVTIPSGTESGILTLVTSNGTEVISSESLTILASNVPIITKIPASMKPGEMITIEGEKLDLLTDVIFPVDIPATMFGTKTATLLEVVVPMEVAKGKGKIRFITFDNEFTESPEILISGTDPVVDPTLVFFNFDNLNSWWGDAGAPENDPALSLDGTNYHRVNQECSGWTGLFWRNGKNDFPADRIGTEVANYVVKFDINILEPMTGGQLRIRFSGSEGDFWFHYKPWETEGPFMTDGWITVTVPIVDFRDNYGWGDIAPTDLSKADSDFGMAFDGGDSMVNICIDNLRFQLIE